MYPRSTLTFSPGAAGPVLAAAGELGDWRDRANCRDTDLASFYPEKGESTKPAKRVCARCEVVADCLEWALGNDERFGVFGGKSERERRRIRDQRNADASQVAA